MKRYLLILVCSVTFIQCTQVGRVDENIGGIRPKPISPPKVTEPPGAVPLDAQAAFQNGLKKLDSGDFYFAIWEFTQAIKHGPSVDHFWFSRGAARANIADFEGALIDFSTAIKLDSTNARYWADRGKLHSMLGEDSTAIADITRAIELDPCRPNYFLRRAAIKKGIGDDDGACKDAYIAVKLNGNYYPNPASEGIDVEACLNYDCVKEISRRRRSKFIPYNPILSQHPNRPRGPGGPGRRAKGAKYGEIDSISPKE